MKKIFKISAVLAVPGAYLLAPSTVLAVCPVCTAAVVAGLGLSRWLGVDDTVSGIWIGGVILSSSLWFFDWLGKKYPRIKTRAYQILTVVITYALVFVPLAWTDIIGHPFNKIWGIDKLVVGAILGTAAFLLGIWADKKVREKKGKQLFNYQRVVFPVALLIISSIALWIITKR
jgi:hypothetical protein